MSVNGLTGFDNRDQTTGKRDHEVFAYDAQSAQLVCASCDPGGARPRGSAFIGAKLGERMSTPFHQPRALSDNGGRLFFSSPDPLVAGVSGGRVKVFEYEEGSVSLLSAPANTGDDTFLDATPSGNDVFIASREPLLAGDKDELVDVFDTRVDGGFHEPSQPAGSCQGEACQGPPSAPPQFSTPISASFSGAGNLTPSPSTSTVVKPTRSQLLARALARCKRVKQRKKRLKCRASARRRYALPATNGRTSAVVNHTRVGGQAR